MKSDLNKILAVVQAAAALCVLGAVKFWAPVCTKMLPLANGNEVHMKCFYTGQAAIGLALVLLVVAVATFFSRFDHKKFQLVSLTGGVMLFLLFTKLIGVCMSADMPCITTGLWCKGLAALMVVTALLDLFSGKEGQLPG